MGANRKLLGLGMTVMVVAVLSAGTAYAVDSSVSSPPANNDSVAARVQERKKTAEKLTPAQASRIQEKCTNAQAVFAKSTNEIVAYDNSLVTKYETFIENLNNLMQERAKSGLNSGDLNAATAALTQRHQAYKTVSTSFSEAVADIGALDCKTDPIGFAATLKQARSDLEALQKARAQLQAHNKDSVLIALRKLSEEKQ